jgi:hypothetical protein
MTHPARTTLAGISLVCCGLSAAACVVSYMRPYGIAADRYVRDSTGDASGLTGTYVAVNSGRVYLDRMVFVRTESWIRIPGHDGLRFGREEATERFTRTWLPYKFERRQVEMLGIVTDRQWTLPLPLPVLLFAILPVRWAVLRRREWRRNAEGVCVKCGYDLRACSDRCSECGETIPARLEIARGVRNEA